MNSLLSPRRLALLGFTTSLSMLLGSFALADDAPPPTDNPNAPAAAPASPDAPAQPAAPASPGLQKAPPRVPNAPAGTGVNRAPNASRNAGPINRQHLIDDIGAARQIQPVEPAPPLPTLVKVEPMILDLGEVAASREQVGGEVKLTNISDKPVKLLECKASCGCTTARCPKGQDIQPGETVLVDVKVNPGLTRNDHFSKTITFKVEGQNDAVVVVNAKIIEFVVLEPKEFDPANPGEGKVVVKSIDDQPFKITEISPAIFTEADSEPKAVHELVFDVEKWDALNKKYLVNFALDHPKMTLLTARLKRPARQPELAQGNELEAQPIQPDNAMMRRTDLLNAIRQGNVEAALKAIGEGGDCETRDSAGRTPLIVAAETGDVPMLKALVETAHCNVEAADRAGFTALTHAGQSNSVDAVKFLLSAGANPNSRDEIGGSPLSWACGPRGFAAAVNELIKAGADVNVANDLGMTPMVWAGGFGDVDRVNMLAQAGAVVNVFGGPQDMTPLMFAVQINKPEVVKALLAVGGEINATDGNLDTALDYAEQRTDDPAVAAQMREILLAAGAKTGAQLKAEKDAATGQTKSGS